MTITVKTSPKSITLEHVRITDGLWQNRQVANRDKTIPAIYDQLQKTGRIEAWRWIPTVNTPKSGASFICFLTLTPPNGNCSG